MKILILTADSNGGYPVPASKGGAVSTLIEHLVDGNNKKQLCRLQVVSLFDEKAFSMSQKYNNISFIWVKVPLIYKLLDKCTFNFVRLLKKKEKSVSFKSVFSLLYYIRKAKKIVNNSDADKVIVENNIPLSLVLKKTRYTGKWYYHLHNVPRIDAKCRETIQKSTKFLCVSQFVADQISSPESAIGQVPPEKNEILYNCVDTSLFRPIPPDDSKITGLKKDLNLSDDDKIMVFVGRLTAEKGADCLLGALKKLPDNYKAVIIGSFHYNANVKSDYQDELNKLAESLKDRVIFTGYVQHDDLPYYYNIADIAVLPSMWDEPAGLTNLESMACGIPVITTYSGGIPEYVGKSIVLKRDERLTDNIASSAAALIENKDEYKRLSEYSRKYVTRNFDKECYIDRFIEAVK